MNDFINQIFLDNSLLQWGILVLVVVAVLLFNPFIGKIIGKILYQFFRRFAPSKGEHFSQLLLKPLEYLIILIALGITLQFMDYPEKLDFSFYGIHTQRLLQIVLQLLMTLTIAWLALRIVTFVTDVLAARAALTETTQDDQFVLFVRDVLRIVVYIAFLFIILGNVFDLNITSLLAGAGIAGLAIALAAQDSLTNLFGSLTIFTEKPFIMGDLVETNGIVGSVEKVGFRSTRLRTLEKTYVTLPNRKIMENALNNLTERTSRRVQYTVGVLYGTPIPVIKKIVSEIQQLIDDHPKTNEDGIVTFFAFGSSSLDIQVIYFIKEIQWSAYLRVREEISLGIIEIVEGNGGSFAFPTTTVHLASDEVPLKEDDSPEQPEKEA